ncbi:MAG: ABC-2 type transport system ATP-binding protein [Polyangiales bacterium]|jgi:ABC-2 type transport system ATP-binding protein
MVDEAKADDVKADATNTEGAPVVSVRGFKKTYRVGFFRKKVEAVRGIDFEVRKGEIFGLLGPNGAGKTTTLKSLLRLSFPSEGTMEIFGLPTSRRESMYRVGYMPENPYIYQHLKAEEFLDLCGRLTGMSRAKRRTRIAEMIEMVGLGHAKDRPVGRFSKGMMQRVGIAQALLHDPELLILDEPMSGLDPVGRKEVRELLLKQRELGKTLIFTSHILSDVEALCDRVAIMRKGKIQARGTVAELSATDGGVDVVVRGADAELTVKLAEMGELKPRPSTLELTLDDTDDLPAFMRLVMESGASVVSVVPHTRSLESLFVGQDADAA